MPSPTHRPPRLRGPLWPMVLVFLAIFCVLFLSSQERRTRLGVALGELVHHEYFWVALPWIAIFVAPFALFFTWLAYRAYRRSNAIAAAAAELGVAYIPSVDDEFGLGLSHFALLERYGLAKNYISNLCYRKKGNLYIALFDYEYESPGSGESGPTTHRHTVLHVRSDKLQLPPFFVDNKASLTWLAKVLPFHNKGLELPQFPEFSRRYSVRSANESAAAQIFTREVVAFLESETRPIVVEGTGAELLCYFPYDGRETGFVSILLEPIADLLTGVDDNRMNPRDVADRMQLGAALGSMFADRGSNVIDATIVEDDNRGRVPPIRCSPEERI